MGHDSNPHTEEAEETNWSSALHRKLMSSLNSTMRLCLKKHNKKDLLQSLKVNLFTW